MNIAIIYFSQTGNTKKIADAMSEVFEKDGHKVKCFTMQEAKVEDILSSDLLGIGTPTFESHAPTPVKNFLKSLPKQEKQNAFIFATGGGAFGNVLYDLEKLLSSRGANVINGFLSLGQIHHPAPSLVGKTPNRPNIEDLDKAKRFAHSLLGYLFKNAQFDNYLIKRKFGFYNLIGCICSANKLIRFLMPKPKNNHDICKQCNLCRKVCPVDNILVRPYPKFNNKCIRCYRCLNICPSKAIHVNWWYGNVVVLALWNETFMRWFGQYEKSA